MALSPLLTPRPVAALLPGLSALTVVAAVVALARPRGGIARWPWSVLVVLTATALGLAGGCARLHSIDSGALRAEAGADVHLTGVLTAPPRHQSEGTALELKTSGGRVLVVTRGPTDELRIGGELAAAGRTAEPAPWQASALHRRGIATVVEANELSPTGDRRGGLSGRLDVVRRRAEVALERGMPEAEAALARGFVLGQDDLIDPATRDDFKRSGLAHLLAVSGQNVVLLCLLAWPLLALAGLTLRTRLLMLLALIAVYVPVAGAGASIQRAGVMGAAGLAAALAGTPRSRWYAVLLAAAVTLALNPRVSGDIGWQLSFAAVIGILIWSRPLANLISRGAPSGTPRRALAEGAAVTLAATVATAPLMAHHFDSFSLASLPANLLALPAVAPAMWLGMLAGITGQIPAIPVEPLNWLNSLCLAYIGQIASWLAAPDWALLDVRLGSWLAVGGAYAVLAAGMQAGLAFARRGRIARGWPGTRPAAAVIAAGLLVAWLSFGDGDRESGPPPDTLRISFLDVGQGDSILLDPPGGEPILVDAGPPGSGVGRILEEHGVSSLAAVLITHDQSDHAGGLGEVADSVTVARVGYAEAGTDLLASVRAAGAQPMALSEGGEINSGELRLTVLWPPAAVLGQAGADPNTHSLVLLSEWRHLSILLTGDAEAEAVPLDPGPVDVLKVGHHGSEDEGLDGLLERSVPKLAVISVGDNGYGHPTPETLAALEEHGVPVARTDADGTIEIEADAAGWSVRP